MCRHSERLGTLQTITENSSHRPRPSEDTLVGSRTSEQTLIGRNDMSSPGGTVDIERRRSFGIGGAGNIRM